MGEKEETIREERRRIAKRKYMRIYREKNRDKYNEYQREYKRKNKDRIKKQQDKYWDNKYKEYCKKEIV